MSDYEKHSTLRHLPSAIRCVDRLNPLPIGALAERPLPAQVARIDATAFIKHG